MQACNYCGSGESALVLKDAVDYEYAIPGRWNLVRCSRCGLVRMEIMPTVEETMAFYPKEYVQYHPRKSRIVAALYRRFVRRQAEIIRDLIGPRGRILDVGCGCGEFMKCVGEVGEWEIVGIEPSAEAAARGRQWGLDIRHGTLESIDLHEEPFDLIIFTHVIEHLVDPLTALQKIVGYLKPGGYLYAETENIESWAFLALQRYWGLLHLPRHLYFFTERTIRNYLHKAGFVDVSINHTFNPGGWALGLQFLLEEKLHKRIYPGRTWYFPYLLVLSMPLGLIQLLMKKADAINFIGRKPGR